MAMAGILDGYYSQEKFANEIDRSSRTVERWDRLGIGPVVTMVGGSKFYHIDDIRTWLKATGTNYTADASA